MIWDSCILARHVHKTKALNPKNSHHSLERYSPYTQQLPTSYYTITMASATVAQQSDNIAHAISGAGGGILSMALT